MPSRKIMNKQIIFSKNGKLCHANLKMKRYFNTEMKGFWVLIFFIIFTLFFSIRSKYHQGAIETDIGSYAYGGQELLRGKLLYVDFFDHKPPGIYFIYALIFKFIGENTYAIKIIASFVVFLNSCFLFLIAKKNFNKTLALGTMLFYLLTMSLPFLQGTYANTEVFMIFFILMANTLIIYSSQKKTFFLAGFALGLATLIKTVAIGNIGAIVFWCLLFHRKKFLKIIYPLFSGIALPIMSTLFYFVINSALGNFWLANIKYNQVYVSDVTFIQRLFSFPELIFIENPGLWIWGFLGIITIIKKNKIKKELWLMVFNILFNLPLISLMGRKHPHYYIQIVPFLVITTIYYYYHKKPDRKTVKQLTISCFFILTPFLFLFNVLVFVSPENLASHIQPFGRGDWYDQSKQLSAYLSQKITPGDFIYNLGRESQIYFYTRTQSSTRFYYDRPFWFFPETINGACQDLAKNKPKLIINTLKEPYFQEKSADYLWEKLKICGNLEIEKKETYLFAEIWYIK